MILKTITNKTTRILAMLIALMMILPLFQISVGAADVSASQNNGSPGIDYLSPDIIVTGKIGGIDNGAYYINLTKETLTVPDGYNITAYSVDGGTKWTAVNAKTKFDSAAMVKLFTKDVTLAFTDKYDTKSKKPAKDAIIVDFAKIAKRPTMKTYTVNYLIGADPSGETPGTWVLTEKNSAFSIKEGIEIAAADSSGKAPDKNGYGKFFGNNGTSNGIQIRPLPQTQKPVSTSYYIRLGAKANSDGTYTLASSEKKITVKGQQKPDTFKVDEKKKTIAYGADTYICINRETTELKDKKGTLDVSEGGEFYLWNAATATTPASAIQKTVVTPGDKTITFTSATVTTIKSLVSFVDSKGNKNKKGVYTKGSKKPYTLKIDKEFDMFSGEVKINGKTLVKDKDYTAKSGSTDITFAAGVLDTPNIGVQTIDVGFSDGIVQTTIDTVQIGGNIYDEIYALLDQLEQKKGKETRDMYEVDLDYFASYEGGLEELRGYLQSAVNDTQENIGIMPLAAGDRALRIRSNGAVVSGTTIEMKVGETRTLEAVLLVNNIDNIPIATEPPQGAVFKWASGSGSASCNPAEGQNTTLTATAVGQATITLKLDGTTDTPTTVIINVTAPAPTGISINPASLSLYQGDTYVLNALVEPAAATDYTITWESSNSSNVDVQSSGTKGDKGNINAVTGTATITARLREGVNNSAGNIIASATCKVTVLPPPVNEPATILPNNKNASAFNLTPGSTATPPGMSPGEVGRSFGPLNIGTTGTQPIDMKLVGTLPKGLTWTVLNGIMTIEGKPTEAGTAEFTVIAENAFNQPNITPATTAYTQRFTITINRATKVIYTNTTPDKGTITAKSGTLTLTDGDYVPLGSNVVFTATPNGDYIPVFEYTSTTGGTVNTSPANGTQNGNNYTVQNVQADEINVMLTFKDKAQVTIVYRSAGNGTASFDSVAGAKISGGGAGENKVIVTEGSDVKIKAQADPGYEFDKWTITTIPPAMAVPPNLTSPTLTIGNVLKNPAVTPPAADIEVVATFKESAPVIKTTTLPDGTIGVAYSQTLIADTTLTDKTMTWQLATGSLPPGLTLNPNGTISGTPTVGQGTPYTFTVIATDSRGKASAAKQLSIRIPGQYTVTFSVVNNLGGTIKADVYNGAVLEKSGISSGALVDDGRDIVFTVSPDTSGGYSIGNWTVTVPNNDYTAPKADNTAATYKATKITGDLDVKITFVKTQEFIVDFGIAGGKGNIEAVRKDTGAVLQPGAYVPLGTEIVFNSTPLAGYRVTNWKWEVKNNLGAVIDSKTEGTNAEQYTLTITGNTRIDVTFEPIYNVTAFSLNKTAITIPGKSTETLIPNLTPASAPLQIVDWHSSDPNVATVDDAGVVTGVSVGTAIITATVPGSLPPATCVVTVAPVSVLSIDNGPTVATTGIPWPLTGTVNPVSALLEYQPYNENLTIVWSIPTKTVNGTVSEILNTAGAKILSGETLTTTKAGQVTVRATIYQYDSTGMASTIPHFKTGTAQEVAAGTAQQLDFTITVSNFIAVKSITLVTVPTPVTAKVPTTLTETVSPANASYKTITWSIDRNNTTTGTATTLVGNVLTADTEGTVRLIATITNGAAIGQDYVHTFDVKVNPITGTVISLNKTTMTVNMGVTDSSLEATVVSNNVTDKSVLWSSSNNNVAAVDYTGKITATGAGTATITVSLATNSAVRATCIVTVPANTQKPVITSLSIADGIAGKNYSAALTATGAAPIKWSISGTTGLPGDLVLNPDTGVITGIPRTVGSYTFAVTATNGVGSDTRNISIKVTDPVTVSGITLHADATTLIIGNTTVIRPTVSPTNATDKGILWTTSNAGVANVSPDGTIIGVGAGEAVITAKSTDGGNRTATSKITVINPPVNGVVLNKNATSIPLGSSETLVATVYPTNAKNRNVLWSTSGTNIATVKDGAVIAVSAGTATITARTEEGNYIATCVVTVTIPVSGITLNKASVTILHGNKDTLVANVIPANATNKTVTWSTSDRTVITVDAAGVITAVAPGKATVTATTADGGKTAICTVTVNPVPVTGITFNKNTTRIPVGDFETITATVNPANATNKTIIWVSSNTNIATVDINGRISGKAEGSAIITATTADGNFTATCSVTVYPIPVTGITVKTSASIGIGGSETLTYSLIPSNATNKNVTWKSSNTSVATVDATGKVTGKAEGTATITATTAEGAFTANCTVKVTPPISVTGVKLNKTSIALIQGASETLTATVSPSDAANKSITWSSSNTSVATVDAAGKVTAKSAGTSTITVRTNDGGKTASCTVTVDGVYNITVVQADGGTAAASHTSARPGTRITMSANIAKDGYYVSWRISPPNVLISGNSFTMPDTDVIITPVYKYIELIDTYTDPAKIDTSKSPFDLIISESVSIPYSTLSNLGRQNSGFAVDADAPFGTYQVPANFASVIPNLNSVISKNNLALNDITFNIIMSDRTSDRGIIETLANDLPQSKIISAVEFTAEIAKLNKDLNISGKTLEPIKNFTRRVIRLIPMPGNMVIMPDNWGVFKYNETSKRFEFVPHTTQTINGRLYAVIKSADNGIFAVAENTVVFWDVPSNEWYAHYVEKAAAKRLLQGVGGGNFAPELDVTRAEFAQMMCNALELPQAAANTGGYSDVPANEWYYEAVMKAKSAGLLSKFTGNNFYPDQPITREEMAVILAAAARRENLAPASQSAVNLSGVFTDYSKINSGYVTDIELVYRLGIMVGTDGGRFDPKGTTTRAEAATVQIRILELLGFIDKDV